MTANLSRVAVWGVGLLLVLAGIYLFWDAAGLDRYVASGVVLAVLVVIGGLGILALARGNGFWGSRRVEHVERTSPVRNYPDTETRVVDDEGRNLPPG